MWSLGLKPFAGAWGYSAVGRLSAATSARGSRERLRAGGRAPSVPEGAPGYAI
ncbi:MAG: hypothetical protein ACI9HI_001283, partial [Salinirussus sp.]